MEARAGLLVPLGGSKKTHICDRFFLGGPGSDFGSLWGFRNSGVGPRQLRHTAAPAAAGRTPRDSLGGDVMGAATLKLIAPFGGQLRDYGIQAQAFVSAGSLESIADVRSVLTSPTPHSAGAAGGQPPGRLHSALRELVRASCGVGIGMPTQLGRLEIMMTHVLKKASTDASPRSGWQVGVSGSLS